MVGEWQGNGMVCVNRPLARTDIGCPLGVNLTTHLQITPMLGMGGVISPVPYVFMAYTETVLLLTWVKIFVFAGFFY
jgi:hypothetical protein